MKRSALILFAALFACVGSVAQAQSSAPGKNALDPRDSVSIADVQRAADELARTVQAAVKQITEDPKLKVAALKLATQSVNAAQVIVSQQAATLQSILEGLAQEVAAATVTIQRSNPKAH